MINVLWILTEIWRYLVYWSPQIAGVAVAGFIVQKYWVARANEWRLIDYFANELSDLVDETLEYWSLDCSKDEGVRQRARVLEQRIKGAINSLNRELRRYSQRYSKNVDFTSLVGDISDACTGGAFEGIKRGPDQRRYSIVVSATHRVRWQLFERRL